MEINSSWSYKECLYYISCIKEKYEGIMSSFCVLGGNRKYFEKMIQIKKQIYSLNFGAKENWKKDKLWEYLNNDITYTELWAFV